MKNMLGCPLRCGLFLSAVAMNLAAALGGIKIDPLADIAPIPGISFKKADAASQVHSAHPRRQEGPTAQYHRMRGIRTQFSGARSAAATLGAHQRDIGQEDEAYQNVTTSNAYGMQYAIWATVGNESVELTLDTGSADTWIVKKDFVCIDYTGTQVDQSTCGFGPAYQWGYQYGSVDDVHLFIRYGDGEIVMGDMGYSDLTLANITVKKQQISLVNETFWYGDNSTSGMLGLAFPSMVNAYLGEWYEHEPYDLEPYPPVFTRMWQEGLVSPLFSLAITRNSTGGLIGWGGVPSVISGLDYSTVAFADIIIVRASWADQPPWLVRMKEYMLGTPTNLPSPPLFSPQASLNNNPSATSSYSFYTIVTDGIAYDTTIDHAKYPYIIDSGTSIIYLPPSEPHPFLPPILGTYSGQSYWLAADNVPLVFSSFLNRTSRLRQ